MKTFFTLFLFFNVIFFVNITCRADESFLDELKELYQFDKWAGSTKTNYLHLVQNWKTDLSTFGATNFYNKPHNDQNKLTISSGIYIFQPTNILNRVDLRIFETPSVLDAHKMMMQFFSNCSAWQPFQTGESIGVNLGDHCYAGYPIGATNGLFFVRNNMFITVTSSTSVYEIAQKIDQQLLAISLTPK